MTGSSRLHAVPEPPAGAARSVRLPGQTVAGAINETKALLAKYGAGLELAVADGAGVEIPVNMVEADLPEQLRVQAVAVFTSERPEVVGQSDPIERAHYCMYEHTIEWLQALGALRAQFQPTAIPNAAGGRP